MNYRISVFFRVTVLMQESITVAEMKKPLWLIPASIYEKTDTYYTMYIYAAYITVPHLTFLVYIIEFMRTTKTEAMN